MESLSIYQLVLCFSFLSQKKKLQHISVKNPEEKKGSRTQIFQTDKQLRLRLADISVKRVAWSVLVNRARWPYMASDTHASRAERSQLETMGLMGLIRPSEKLPRITESATKWKKKRSLWLLRAHTSCLWEEEEEPAWAGSKPRAPEVNVHGPWSEKT